VNIIDILGFILLGLAGVAILLRLFGKLDISWPMALLPLLLFLLLQIAVAVSAGVGNYFEYLRGVGGKLGGA
jgi:hypothetical protein